MFDLGFLSSAAIIAASEYLAEKAAGAAANSVGAKVVDWLQQKFTGSDDKAALDKLVDNPNSGGAKLSVQGALLSKLEGNDALIQSLEELLHADAHSLTQSISGNYNSVIGNQGGHNTITISTDRR